MKKRKSFSVCAILMIFMKGICFAGDTKLNAGVLKLTSSAPIFIGIEKGFFKEEGLTIDLQWFESAQPIAVATASNKIDVGATGITAGLFNMIAGGQKLLIVADKGREYKDYSSSAVLVTTEQWNSGVRKLVDLKGKKIGITQIGSTFHYMIGRLLDANGIGLADVDLIPLSKIGALTASLQGRQVDAVILNEPNISKALLNGYGKLIVQVGDVMDYQISAIFFSPDFAENSRETAIKFLKGYIQSTRYYYDAVLVGKNGKRVPGKHYDEVIGIIAKYTGAPVDDIKNGMPYMDRDGKLLVQDIQTQIDWYASHQMIEKKISAEEVTDPALWQAAYDRLK